MATVVVTGAASGMGRESLEKLRTLDGERVDLVGVDLRPPEIEGAVGVACDVADPDAVTALVERVRELGPFRALVHAAGISPTMADARRVFEVDLVGTQRLLDGFEPLVVPEPRRFASRRRPPTRSPPSSTPVTTSCSTTRWPPTSSIASPARSPTAATPTRWPSGA